MKNLTRALAVCAFALAVAGCAPTPLPEPEESFVPPPAPTPTATPFAEVEPDTMVVVRAKATAPNGATLDLELRVRQSTAFDDVGSQTVPTAMAETCAGYLDFDIFAEQRWSFTRGNIAAVAPTDGTEAWPESSLIRSLPSANFVNLAARGSLLDDPAAGAEVPACRTDKVLNSLGNGAFAIGIPGDVTIGDTAGVPGPGSFVRWANHRYGFESPADSGIVLSDCSFEVTELGVQFGGSTPAWSSIAEAGQCSIGATTEVQEF